MKITAKHPTIPQHVQDMVYGVRLL